MSQAIKLATGNDVGLVHDDQALIAAKSNGSRRRLDILETQVVRKFEHPKDFGQPLNGVTIASGDDLEQNLTAPGDGKDTLCCQFSPRNV